MRWLLLLWLSVFAIPHAQAQEVLNWASDGEANVPYVFHDPVQQSRLEGFEYEIVQELGNRLHMTPHFIQNDWDGLVPGLQRGMYQMVIDGIEMTPEHREAVLFSRPYYVTGSASFSGAMKPGWIRSKRCVAIRSAPLRTRWPSGYSRANPKSRSDPTRKKPTLFPTCITGVWTRFCSMSRSPCITALSRMN